MPSAKKISKYTAMQRKEMPVGFLMLLPAVLGLTVFVVVPLIMAVQKSFYEWNFYKDSVWVGLENFRLTLTNRVFQRSVVTVFKFVLILVPLQMVIQFAFAHTLLKVSRKFSNMVKIAIYIPGIISGIVAGIIFTFIFEYKGGLANQLITSLGGQRIAFRNNGFWAVVSICFPVVWLGLGGGTILNFAGLINVPGEYYEAASIDGAGGFQKLIRITLPQMKNIFVLQIIGLITGTLQILEIPMVMTDGGPREQTLTPMYHMFRTFRDQGRSMGFTVAGALLMMFLIAAVNSLVFTIIRSEKSIEG